MPPRRSSVRASGLKAARRGNKFAPGADGPKTVKLGGTRSKSPFEVKLGAGDKVTVNLRGGTRRNWTRDAIGRFA